MDDETKNLSALMKSQLDQLTAIYTDVIFPFMHDMDAKMKRQRISKPVRDEFLIGTMGKLLDWHSLSSNDE